MGWEDYVKCDLKVLKMYNWKKQAKSRKEWKQEHAKTGKELQR